MDGERGNADLGFQPALFMNPANYAVFPGIQGQVMYASLNERWSWIPYRIGRQEGEGCYVEEIVNRAAGRRMARKPLAKPLGSACSDSNVENGRTTVPLKYRIKLFIQGGFISQDAAAVNHPSRPQNCR